VRLLRAKVSARCSNASAVVCANLDACGASCLECQRRFGVGETPRHMVFRSRAIEGVFVELISELNLVCLGALPQVPPTPCLALCSGLV
jgi:hypothetical protein